jgi:hypothetical protein
MPPQATRNFAPSPPVKKKDRLFKTLLTITIITQKFPDVVMQYLKTILFTLLWNMSNTDYCPLLSKRATEINVKLSNSPISKEFTQSYITTDSQSASPSWGVRRPSGTRDQFFFLLEIFFRQLRVCYFVTPSLTRGRVCNLLLLLVLASAAPIGSESWGTRDHILLPQFLRLPQPGGSSGRRAPWRQFRGN